MYEPLELVKDMVVWFPGRSIVTLAAEKHAGHAIAGAQLSPFFM